MTNEAAAEFDIAIGGGGLTGHLMALALAGALGPGTRIAIFDPAPKFGGAPDDPRASAISLASQLLLETAGVWDELAEQAQPIRQILITDSSLDAALRKTQLTYDNHAEHPLTGEAVPASSIVPNSALVEAAYKRVMAVRQIVRITSAIDEIELTPLGVTLHAGGTRHSARLLIAADGARSKLRARAGIQTVRRDHGQTAIVTMVAHDVPHEGTAIQHFLPGGPFAILPMTGHRSCITWSENARVARGIMAMDDAAFLQEIEMRFGAQLGPLRLAGGRRSFPLVTAMAREPVATRMALIGDAAHAVHPIAGQGLNIGIRDIAALAECIADAADIGLDPGDPSVLERYARWRRFDNVSSAATFVSLNLLFSNDFTLLRSVREVGLGVVDRWPGLKRRLVTEAAGLNGDVPKLLRGLPV